jgi:phospholipid-binding lipoprotein MlaA
MPTRTPTAILLTLALCAGLQACAVRRAGGPERDPWEGFNRKMFWFNDKVDAYALEPVATGWEKITPRRVRTSVSNFFQNLRFPIVATNDLLQWKPLAAGSDVGRFAVNTTVGVLGFFDPASRWGLAKHDEDFGQTLGRWGVPAGPYVVLPLLGPSSPRDAGGLAVDAAFAVTPFFVDWWILAGARVFDTVNERSQVLKEVRDIKESAFDYYGFVRNAYMQRRTAQVQDSAEASPETDEELYHPDLNPEFQ